MTRLCATTQQLWRIEAKRLLKQKGLRRKQLRRLFQRVIFQGDKTYDSHRFFFKLEMSELPLFVVVNLAKSGKCSPYLVFPGAKWHHPKLALSKHHMIMNNKDVDFPAGSAGSVGVAGIRSC